MLTLEPQPSPRRFHVKATIGLGRACQDRGPDRFRLQHRQVRGHQQVAAGGGGHRDGQALRPHQPAPLRFQVLRVHADQDQQGHHRRADDVQPRSRSGSTRQEEIELLTPLLSNAAFTVRKPAAAAGERPRGRRRCRRSTGSSSC
ncbi:MAG: hypothetical protein MZV70_37625 [Desulfobacterales bacterium]|nr:hypothetical protein [Desulfobacterales bacterium]